MRRCNTRTLTFLTLALSCCLPAMSAVKMTQTLVFHGYGPSNAGKNRATTTTLIQGVRSRTETSMEFEGKVLRRLTGKQTNISITDGQRKVMLGLDAKRETYTEMSFEQFLTQRDQLTDQLAALRGQTPQQSPEDGQERPQMEFSPPEVTITAAGTAQIAGYEARLMDVRVKMVGSYPESTETCDIRVSANLGFAETPGSDEVQAYYAAIAEELGFSRSQLLGAGQSVLSAMGNYAEGFEKLYDEIRKQKGTMVRQNLRVEVKGACGGPGSAGAAGTQATAPDSGQADSAEAPVARVKKMFGKLKLGRKKKNQEQAPEETPQAPAPSDVYTLMMAFDMETDSYEKVADLGNGPFAPPSGWKKIEQRGLAAAPKE